MSEKINETSRDWAVCRAVDSYRAPRAENDERTLSDFLETEGLAVYTRPPSLVDREAVAEALDAIQAQCDAMRSLKGWRLNLIRENLAKAKAALSSTTAERGAGRGNYDELKAIRLALESTPTESNTE